MYKFQKDDKLITKPIQKEQEPSPLFTALSDEKTVEEDSEWEIYREAYRGIPKCKCIRIGAQFQATSFQNLCDNSVFHLKQPQQKECIEQWDASRLSNA